MAITQKWLSMDSYYRETPGDKIILNDINYYSMGDMELVQKQLMTVYDNDVISLVPSCDCGKVKGRYRLNKTCPNCGSVCKDPSDKVYPLLWFKALDSTHRFISPDFWLILRMVINKNIDYLYYLCDPKETLSVTTPPFLVGILNIMNGNRSYDNLIANMDNILVYLINHSVFKAANKQATFIALLEMWRNEKDKLLSEHIPIINKKLFVVEKTNKGKFMNLSIAEAIDVVMSWSTTVHSNKLNNNAKSVATANVISKLATLYHTYFSKYLSKKSGILRKHVYGARSYFTFRAVIVPITGRHDYRELHLPWAIGVTVFRPHIINKLVKMGYNITSASNKLFAAVKHFDEEIYGILNTLIGESKYDMGIPCVINRNQH